MQQPDLVTVTEAAGRAALNKSTVSRQVRDWGIAKDSQGRFDFAAYQRRRSRDLDLAMQGNHAGRLLGDAPPPAEPDADFDEPETAAPTGGEGLSYRKAKTAGEEFKAKLAELDYRKRVGELVPIEVVEQREAESDMRIAAAIEGLRAALLALPKQLAEGEARARLDAGIRAALEQASDAFTGDQHVTSAPVADGADAALEPAA